uniref:Putative multiple-sugar transport system permease YteP n=1 Tax=uncultured Bacillota bacterium TaxID=344338 RepID=A0A650ENB4_9FIRM|nr:putative multiple-sugar transport system permease YteP [uncultured Firmicutes bacterium]
MKTATTVSDSKLMRRVKLRKRWNEQKYLFLMILPCLAYYFIFHYMPMYGVIIAFKKFDMVKGIMGSSWVGLDNFVRFFEGPYAFRLIKNTLLLSIYNLIFYFPIPIIFALFLNEVKNKWFKKAVQTVSYLPHFVSVVIVVGMLQSMLSPSTGIINRVITSMGGEAINFFMQPNWFRTLYISSTIWQEFGWGSIIYLAALSSVDAGLYEAAHLDGAGRFRCMWHITLPAISPTIITLLILKVGNLLTVGYEKVIMMYNPGIYETADIISSYVYRVGVSQANYSFGTAVGLMNSIVSMLLILITNTVSKKLTETSLW